MDPLPDISSLAAPSVLDHTFSAAQAQQLLQSAGWIYYTIWRKDPSQNPLVSSCGPGLVWSQGDVNRSLLMPDQNNANAASSELITSTRKACKMGYLLQELYKYCSFLPSGLGVAGMAMTSGRYQWANNREEIFNQLRSLSTCSRQHLPTDLQEGFFETLVCIPLQNGAGVLEMGTNALVPKSEGMLQMLGSTEGLETGIHREREQERFLNPALNSSSELISVRHNPGQSNEHGGYIEEHNVDILKAMMYGGRDISSMPSSNYCSSSSARVHFINKQQGAAAADFINTHIQEHTAGSGDDHHLKMGRYAGIGSTAAEVSRSRHGAFKSWRRSLLAVTSRKKQTQTARSDSFLKKVLVHYLPRQQRKAGVWIEHGIKTGLPQSLIGYVQDLTRASSFQQLSLQGAEAAQVAAGDESPSQAEVAAVNHMIAERNRRRKQAECYKALRTLVPDTAKKDKVALLEHSILYLKELKDRVFELYQEKSALGLKDNEDNKDSPRGSSIHTSSQSIASCSYHPSAVFKDGNYFLLNVKTLSINHGDINMTNINIASALQRKNLHCIKFKSELKKSTQKVDIEILAKYKVGDNCNLSINGIQEIMDWWPTFVKKFEILQP